MTNSRSGQTTVLMASVTLNVVLIGVIFWLGVHNGRILMQSYVEAAVERAEIRKKVLEVLNSGDSQQVEILKGQLKLAIEVDQRVAYKLGATGEAPKAE
jgi:hypothetical protein